jgi:hypothetical protein
VIPTWAEAIEKQQMQDRMIRVEALIDFRMSLMSKYNWSLKILVGLKAASL